ncbi:hypothetical protein KAX02_13555 [candidate division WOR-3 bacterium]|nr:hypothetical protein [candidate division WOR-3 bacterium]
MSNNKQKPPVTSKIKIDINNLPMHICPACSNTVFSEATEIRLLSAIVSPSGKSEIIKVPVAICSLCGKKVMNSDLEESALRGSRGENNVILQS